jgi:hypothetical protein
MGEERLDHEPQQTGGEPEWLDRPAVIRLSISSPYVLNPFQRLNRGKAYSEQIKPLNFIFSAITHPFGEPDGFDPATFRAVAPFEKDPAKWLALPWFDLGSGRRIRITTQGVTGGPGLARVKSVREVIDEHQLRPEPKSCDLEGRPCSRDTRGLLNRRPVVVGAINYIGKESHRLEEAQAGVVTEEDFVSDFGPAASVWELLVRPVLKYIPASLLESRSGLSRRQVKRLRNDYSRPRRKTEAILTRIASIWALERLAEIGIDAEPGLDALAQYLDLKDGD